MSDTTVGPAVRPGALTAAGAVSAVLVAGLLVPGGGLVVALVLAATVLRGRPSLQRVLVVLGSALLLLALGAHALPGGEPTLHIGPATPVQPAG